ncbi:MAG: signal transduction histidine kinase [Bacteriovoracaceae bacterium]|jgi:signal transduction histidine kinase
MNILLIEDDPSDIEYIKHVLSEDSIEAVQTHPNDITKEYDLIIVDFFFKGKTSLPFLEEISRKPDFKTPVIIISGKVNEVNLSELPESLNALVLSKNDKFNELLKYYKNLICKTEVHLDNLEYKTLFLNLVHDLRNDLSPTVLLDQLDSNDPSLDEIKNIALDSASFAYSRLEEMSTFLNDTEEKHLSIEDIFKIIIKAPLIKKFKDSISIDGDIKKPITTMPSYFLSVIIKNLVENSCKYSDPDRKLKINLTYLETTDYTHITLEDNAQGIQQEIVDKLFIDNQKSKSGLGIGLIILNRIINSYNGTVQVHSEEKKGTTIKIKFPKTISN